MLKSQFDSIEDFNTFYNNRLISSNKVLKVDASVFTLFSVKEYTSLREVTQGNIQTIELRNEAAQTKLNEIIDSHTLAGNDHQLAEIQVLQDTFTSSDYATANHYIYPYSRTLFLSSFFSDFIPSFSTDFYSCATTKLSIFRQIGSGHGQSVIFKDYNISAVSVLDSINASCSITSQISSVSETISKIDSIVSKQNNDIQFMNNYISELETLVSELKSQLDIERKQGVNGYHRTWH